MKKKNKIKLYNEQTEDEFVYEIIKGMMQTQKHIPYDCIRDTALEVAAEVKKRGFKFKE